MSDDAEPQDAVPEDAVPCPHPTDDLEVRPIGGTLCHACGGLVDWSKDPETNSNPMWYRCPECGCKTQLKPGSGNRCWQCTECKAAGEYPWGPHVRTVLRTEAERVRHGTRNQYNQGCRCQECKAEVARYHRERRAKVKEKVPEKDESLEHGTYSTYTNYRCRCEKCCQANHDYHQGRKAKPTRWATYSPQARKRAEAKIKEREGGSG